MKRGERAAWEAFLAAPTVAPAPKAHPVVKPVPQTYKRTRQQLEHEIQKTFIDWCRVAEIEIPELHLMHAIPNGGQRHPAVAGKLRSEGVLAGIPDLHLPVLRLPYASLYMEVKAPGENPTQHQKERISELRAAGNVAAVCRSVGELRALTLAYLGGNVHDEQGTMLADQ